MTFKVRQIRNNLFLSFLVSYLIILIVPLFIGGFIYLKTVNLVNNQILKANNLYLSQLKQTFDVVLEDIDRISLEIGVTNKDVISLAMKDSILDSDRLAIYNICRQLSQYKISKSYLEDIYIYLKKTDIVINPKDCTSATMYYNVYLKDQMDFDDWYRFIQNDYRRALNTLPVLSKDGDEESITVYTQSLPAHSLSSSYASLVIVINKKELVDNLKAFEGISKGKVFILGKDGKILLSTGKSHISNNISYDELVDNKNSLVRDNVIISYISSDILPLKYVSVVPNESFWESLSYYKRMIMVGGAIILIIGQLLALYMARKNYNPIKSIIKKIMQAGGFKKKDEPNDYEFIQKAISTTINEKESALEMLNKKDLLLRNTYIKHLLRERIEFKDDVKNMLMKYGINFNNEYLIIIHIAHDNSNNEKVDNEYLMAVKEIASDTLESNIDIAGNYIILEGDNCDLILILNVGYKLENEYKSKLSNMLSDIIYKVRTETGSRLIITVSNEHKCPSGFPGCSAEASDAMEYAVLNGKLGIIFYEDVKKSTYGYSYSLETKQKILAFIRNGNSEGAKSVIEELIDNNYEDILLPSEIMRTLIFDVTISVLRILNKSEDLYYLEEIRPINRLMECTSVNSMKTEFFKIVDEICDYIKRNNQSDARSQLVAKVQEYIFCYYANKDMNINSIGFHFNLTPHYLARIYKEETGESLLSHIDKIRIEKAKQLLALDDKYTIGEIADMVGYTNSHALIRAFKKYEGITPGKYQTGYKESAQS